MHGSPRPLHGRRGDGDDAVEASSWFAAMFGDAFAAGTLELLDNTLGATARAKKRAEKGSRGKGGCSTADLRLVASSRAGSVRGVQPSGQSVQGSRDARRRKGDEVRRSAAQRSGVPYWHSAPLTPVHMSVSRQGWESSPAETVVDELVTKTWIRDVLTGMRGFGKTTRPPSSATETRSTRPASEVELSANSKAMAWSCNRF